MTTVIPTPADLDVDVRLVWAPRDAGSRLAGAWWPRSRDATTELQALLPAVSDHIGGAPTRVSLNIDAWDPDQPRRLQVGHTLVRVGWFHTLDRATVTFGRNGHSRLDVVVIPHDANATAAQALLDRLSTASEWPESAGAVVDAVVGGGLRAWAG